MNVVFWGIPPDTKVSRLRPYAEQAGTVLALRVSVSGVGLVTYPDQASVDRAVAMFNGQTINGYLIHVQAWGG